jgi:small ligand-binding sensory domain FIST
MTVVAALSQHPASADATAEVAGQVLDHGEVAYDLAVVFASPHHRDAFAEITATIRSLVGPRRLIGTTAVGVLGGPREVEDGPALVLWVAQLPATPAPVRVTAASTASGTAIQGLPASSDEHTLVLLADPFSMPVADLLDVLAARPDSARVVGGLASAGLAPGTNLFALDGEVYTDGAVGVLVDHSRGGGSDIIVSQGCRPVGSPMIVTKGQANLVLELAGQPALLRLQQVAEQISAEERNLLATQGVHLGIVADEHGTDFGRGDFLVRNVVGADQDSGGLSVGAMVEVGTTVQFHVRDAASADEDLRALLADRRAEGALVFTCNGRGRELFGKPDHDAQLVAGITKDAAVAGMFCAGEVGPVGGRSFLHGFTASMLLV